MNRGRFGYLYTEMQIIHVVTVVNCEISLCAESNLCSNSSLSQPSVCNSKPKDLPWRKARRLEVGKIESLDNSFATNVLVHNFSILPPIKI